MTYADAAPSSAWPLLVYAVLVLFLVAAIIALSYVLGQRHGGAEGAFPYESGVSATGTARFRFSVRFYLLAMFFVIFDLESAFLFAWAIALKKLGWTGYLGAGIFSLTLLLMIFYLARAGALDFATGRGRTPVSQDSPGASAERR